MKVNASLSAFPADLGSHSSWESVQDLMKAQFSGVDICLNTPRADWAEYQRTDELLGPIYEFLTATSKDSPSSFPKNVRTRAQSYRLTNGILLYRSIREVGQLDLDEGWVIAVPQKLIPKVIETFHGDHASGHGGVRKTTLAIRQRFHFRNMRAKVTKALARCVACKRAKSRVAELETPLSPMVSSNPLRGNLHRHLLAWICHFRGV